MKSSYFALHGLESLPVHNHPDTEKCPGAPDCYSVFFSMSALCDELMSATIRFANARINHPQDITAFFHAACAPTEIPRLRECRDIQKKTRKLLVHFSEIGQLMESSPMKSDSFRKDFYESAAKRRGSNTESPRHIFDKTRIAEAPTGLHVIAQPITTFSEREGDPSKLNFEFIYRFACASLDDLSFHGFFFLLHNDTRMKVCLCAREGCDTIFIDRKSRGMPRKYCKTDKCVKIVAKERVAKSRRAKK